MTIKRDCVLPRSPGPFRVRWRRCYAGELKIVGISDANDEPVLIQFPKRMSDEQKEGNVRLLSAAQEMEDALFETLGLLSPHKHKKLIAEIVAIFKKTGRIV